MAAIDGIKNKIDPGQPLDRDIYAMSKAELAEIPSTPGSLDAALNALERDHKFLLEGGVFTEDAIVAWLEYKRDSEINEMAQRPHPYEFYLYYGN
jgi:glutamine synthetase